jgi:hypothetical protein
MSDQTQFNLSLPIPPLPSLPPSSSLIKGKFDYIKEPSYKDMLVNAYQAITQTETWHFVKKPCESFMLSKDPLIWVISQKMEELGYDNHSGSSFGCTMCDMQYIAQYGEQAFKELYIRNN